MRNSLTHTHARAYVCACVRSCVRMRALAQFMFEREHFYSFCRSYTVYTSFTANDNAIPLETTEEVEDRATEEVDTSIESSEEETNVISEHVSNEEGQNNRYGDNVEETVDTNKVEVNHEHVNAYDTANEDISEEHQEQPENDSEYENIHEKEQEEELEEEIPELANNDDNEELELLDANLQVLDSDVPNNQENEVTEQSEHEKENEENNYTEEEENEDSHGEIGGTAEDAIEKEGVYEAENEEHGNNDLEEESNRSANLADDVERVPDIEEIIFSDPFVSEPDQIRGHKWIYNAIEGKSLQNFRHMIPIQPV